MRLDNVPGSCTLISSQWCSNFKYYGLLQSHKSDLLAARYLSMTPQQLYHMAMALHIRRGVMRRMVPES